MKLIGWWVLGLLIVTGASLIVVNKLPGSYKASGLFFVTREPDSATKNYFTYEGYYAGQTAERFTDSALGLIKSLSFKQLALVRSGFPSDAAAVKKLSNSTVSQKVGPQILAVSVVSENPEKSKALWQALAAQAVTAVADLNKAGDMQVSLQVLSSTPLIEDVSLKPILIVIASLLGYLALSLCGWGVARYLRGPK